MALTAPPETAHCSLKPVVGHNSADLACQGRLAIRNALVEPDAMAQTAPPETAVQGLGHILEANRSDRPIKFLPTMANR